MNPISVELSFATVSWSHAGRFLRMSTTLPSSPRDSRSPIEIARILLRGKNVIFHNAKADIR